MGWMYDEYRLIKGGHPKDFITGKPVALGGLAERTVSTGYGGYYVLDKVLHDLWSKVDYNEHVRVAVQGFGKVGYWFAEKCWKEGMKVVALSNEHGAVYSPHGLHIEDCRTLLGPTGGRDWDAVVKAHPGSSKITNEELLQLEVDVLAPAAMENVLTADNADKVRAKLVLELANGPTTGEADAILKDKGVPVVPDIIANAGGVVVSYFEWLQNRHAEERSHEQIMDGLKDRMQDATGKMLKRHLEKGMSLRTAAYALAIKRIGEATECLGTKTFFSPAKSRT